MNLCLSVILLFWNNKMLKILEECDVFGRTKDKKTGFHYSFRASGGQERSFRVKSPPVCLHLPCTDLFTITEEKTEGNNRCIMGTIVAERKFSTSQCPWALTFIMPLSIPNQHSKCPMSGEGHSLPLYHREMFLPDKCPHSSWFRLRSQRPYCKGLYRKSHRGRRGVYGCITPLIPAPPQKAKSDLNWIVRLSKENL